MTKKTVSTLGVIFIVAGILGFIPGLVTDGRLFGIFDAGTGHNLIYLLIGLVGIVMAATGEEQARLFAQIFGIAYLLVLIIGLFTPNVLNIMTVNAADNILHAVFAAIFLVVGFSHAPSSRLMRA